MKTWALRRRFQAERTTRTIRANFIEARGENALITGRIYESNPVPVISFTTSCKPGGDHIRRAKASAEGINRRQFLAPEGDLEVPSGLAKNGDAPVNGIENFWNQAKRHLRKFNGIKPDNFYWFLKECEWRFNGEGHQHLLKQLKYWYKSTKH